MALPLIPAILTPTYHNTGRKTFVQKLGHNKYSTKDISFTFGGGKSLSGRKELLEAKLATPQCNLTSCGGLEPTWREGDGESGEPITRRVGHRMAYRPAEALNLGGVYEGIPIENATQDWPHRHTPQKLHAGSVQTASLNQGPLFSKRPGICYICGCPINEDGGEEKKMPFGYQCEHIVPVLEIAFMCGLSGNANVFDQEIGGFKKEAAGVLDTDARESSKPKTVEERDPLLGPGLFHETYMLHHHAWTTAKAVAAAAGDAVPVEPPCLSDIRAHRKRIKSFRDRMFIGAGQGSDDPGTNNDDVSPEGGGSKGILYKYAHPACNMLKSNYPFIDIEFTDGGVVIHGYCIDNIQKLLGSLVYASGSRGKRWKKRVIETCTPGHDKELIRWDAAAGGWVRAATLDGALLSPLMVSNLGETYNALRVGSNNAQKNEWIRKRTETIVKYVLVPIVNALKGLCAPVLGAADRDINRVVGTPADYFAADASLDGRPGYPIPPPIPDRRPLSPLPLILETPPDDALMNALAYNLTMKACLNKGARKVALHTAHLPGGIWRRVRQIRWSKSGVLHTTMESVMHTLTCGPVLDPRFILEKSVRSGGGRRQSGGGQPDDELALVARTDGFPLANFISSEIIQPEKYYEIDGEEQPRYLRAATADLNSETTNTRIFNAIKTLFIQKYVSNLEAARNTFGQCWAARLGPQRRRALIYSNIILEYLNEYAMRGVVVAWRPKAMEVLSGLDETITAISPADEQDLLHHPFIAGRIGAVHLPLDHLSGEERVREREFYLAHMTDGRFNGLIKLIEKAVDLVAGRYPLPELSVRIWRDVANMEIELRGEDTWREEDVVPGAQSIDDPLPPYTQLYLEKYGELVSNILRGLSPEVDMRGYVRPAQAAAILYCLGIDFVPEYTRNPSSPLIILLENHDVYMLYSKMIAGWGEGGPNSIIGMLADPAPEAVDWGDVIKMRVPGAPALYAVRPLEGVLGLFEYYTGWARPIVGGGADQPEAECAAVVDSVVDEAVYSQTAQVKFEAFDDEVRRKEVEGGWLISYDDLWTLQEGEGMSDPDPVNLDDHRAANFPARFLEAMKVAAWVKNRVGQRGVLRGCFEDRSLDADRERPYDKGNDLGPYNPTIDDANLEDARKKENSLLTDAALYCAEIIDGDLDTPRLLPNFGPFAHDALVIAHAFNAHIAREGGDFSTLSEGHPKFAMLYKLKVLEELFVGSKFSEARQDNGYIADAVKHLLSILQDTFMNTDEAKVIIIKQRSEAPSSHDKFTGKVDGGDPDGEWTMAQAVNELFACSERVSEDNVDENRRSAASTFLVLYFVMKKYDEDRELDEDLLHFLINILMYGRPDPSFPEGLLAEEADVRGLPEQIRTSIDDVEMPNPSSHTKVLVEHICNIGKIVFQETGVPLVKTLVMTNHCSCATWLDAVGKIAATPPEGPANPGRTQKPPPLPAIVVPLRTDRTPRPEVPPDPDGPPEWFEAVEVNVGSESGEGEAAAERRQDDVVSWTNPAYGQNHDSSEDDRDEFGASDISDSSGYSPEYSQRYSDSESDSQDFAPISPGERDFGLNRALSLTKDMAKVPGAEAAVRSANPVRRQPTLEAVQDVTEGNDGLRRGQSASARLQSGPVVDSPVLGAVWNDDSNIGRRWPGRKQKREETDGGDDDSDPADLKRSASAELERGAGGGNKPTQKKSIKKTFKKKSIKKGEKKLTIKKAPKKLFRKKSSKKLSRKKLSKRGSKKKFLKKGSRKKTLRKKTLRKKSKRKLKK